MEFVVIDFEVVVLEIDEVVEIEVFLLVCIDDEEEIVESSASGNA